MLLAKLLRDEHKWFTSSWYYSTELRVIAIAPIYSIFFYPADAPAGTKVLLNGQDFSSVTRATAKDLCKAAKMQFKANDLDKFANGDKNIVSASSSAFRWDIQEDNGTIYFTFTKNNVKINYK